MEPKHFINGTQRSIFHPNPFRWKTEKTMYFYEFFSVVVYVHSQGQCDAVDQIIIEGNWMYLKGKVFTRHRATFSLISLASQALRTKSGTQIDEGSEESHTLGNYFREIVVAQTILNEQLIMVTTTDLPIAVRRARVEA